MVSEMLPIDRVFRTVHLVVGQPREVTSAKIRARLENENLRSSNNSILWSVLVKGSRGHQRERRRRLSGRV
jgi:hypothetical protein